ncbi:unnamed protein product [Spirodela intermedia]|uniref:Uncharacterized protein n=2 Tax=Spirodela intermedia TaxID=51605 RepID=A0A7I8KIR8_SPIIN|nr:unnamed protein product [Spirodela intermedia]CAA6660726.1 unnamed protein product [Spirodela intermedia]CAA7397094.1 unnamed protein product [Spirodela intermedia]
MRDFASCYNEHAVSISDSSCSGSGSVVSAKDPSVQRSVACFYRVKLSTQKELLVKVAWSKSLIGQGFSVGVEDYPSHHHPTPTASAGNSLLVRKKKGSRSHLYGDTLVELHWDISSAKYVSGSEPVEGFYVVMIVNSELGLLLGDTRAPHIKKLEETRPAAEFRLISRREQVVGGTLYLTKARFGDEGRDHEILIKCMGDGRDTKDSELFVCIDKKKVVHVRRLRWNFRGNHTIFVDGSPVDMMWDVHDWWFSETSSRAAFMFRARSALESRPWLLEEETVDKEQGGGKSGFSLLIYAFRNP